MDNLNNELVEKVALLLSEPDARHPDFMHAVTDKMYEFGVNLFARQDGIQGTTYFWIEAWAEVK